MCLDTTDSYKKFLKEEWREDQQEEGKRIQLLDDLADGKDYASLKREAEDRFNVENKTVEMVVKDLLLADNQKKCLDCPWEHACQIWSP